MSAARPKKMLIIEDEEDLRFTLARAISMLPGTMVLEAPDLCSARRAIELHKDLCLGITDIRLPDGNGLDLIRELRRSNNLLLRRRWSLNRSLRRHVRGAVSASLCLPMAGLN